MVSRADVVKRGNDHQGFWKKLWLHRHAQLSFVMSLCVFVCNWTNNSATMVYTFNAPIVEPPTWFMNRHLKVTNGRVPIYTVQDRRKINLSGFWGRGFCLFNSRVFNQILIVMGFRSIVLTIIYSRRDPSEKLYSFFCSPLESSANGDATRRWSCCLGAWITGRSAGKWYCASRRHQHDETRAPSEAKTP